MASDPHHDIFVSHSIADEAWVRGYLIDALVACGLRIHSTAEFPLGTPYVTAFEDAVTQARRVVLVVTSAYLNEPVLGFVDVMAQAHGADESTWPVIPVMREDVKLPPRLAMLRPLDATSPASWPAVVEALCRQLRESPPPDAPRPPCPYPGLRPFTEADSARFFGRAPDIDEMVRRLHAHRFLAIIGRSGTGKSSLVFAGLVPRLPYTTLLGAGPWTVRAMRPGATPLAALEAALAGPPPAVPPEAQPARTLLIVDQFEELFAPSVPADQAAALQHRLRAWLDQPGCFLVITVRADFYHDLMECSLWPEVQSHRHELRALDRTALRDAIALPARREGVHLEDALIAKLLDDAAHEPGALPLVQETLVLLWDKLQRRFLSLAAYAELGRDRRSGLQVAIALHADAAMARLPDDAHRAIGRRIFLRLTQFGAGRPDTRRQQRRSDLRSSDDGDAFDRTLGELIASRLVVPAGTEDADAPIDMAHEQLLLAWPALRQWITDRRDAETARRALEDRAADWVRLGGQDGGLLDEIALADAQRWLADAARADVGASARLRALIAASEVEVRRRKDELEAAHEERLRQAGELARLEQRRADEQRAAAEEQRAAAARLGIAAEKLRRWLRVAVGVGVLALIAAGLAGLFYLLAGQQTRVAEQQTRVAEQQARDALALSRTAHAAQYAARSRAERDLAPHTAVLLAVEAVKATRNDHVVLPAADEALREALGNTSGTTLHGRGRVRTPHTRGGAMAIAHQGDLVAIGGSSGALSLWSLSQTPPVAMPPVQLDGAIEWLAFDGRDQRLVARLSTRTVVVFRVSRSSAPAAPVKTATIHAADAAFSPALGLLAVTDDSGETLQIVDVSARSRAGVLEQRYHTNTPITAMAFSTDGRFLVAVLGLRQIAIWDSSQPADLRERPVPSQMAARPHAPPERLALAVSRGAAHLLLMIEHPVLDDREYTGELWDLSGATPELQRELPAVFQEATFSPDGSSLTLVSNYELTSWDTTTARQQSRARNDSAYSALALSPDGQSTAISDRSKVTITRRTGETRVYKVPTPESEQREILQLVFTSDGQKLAGQLADDTAIVWDLTDMSAGWEPREVPVSDMDSHGGWIAFMRDHRVYVQRVDGLSPAILVPLPITTQPADAPSNLALSDAGDWLAVTLGVNTVYLFDLTAADPFASHPPLQVTATKISFCSFSPRGAWLAVHPSSGEAAVVRLRHDGSDPEIQYLPVYQGGDLQFSADDSWLVAGADADTPGRLSILPRLWRLDDHELAAPHDLAPRGVHPVAFVFSDDGRWLAATDDNPPSSDDHRIYLWALSLAASPGPPASITRRTRSSTLRFSPDARWLVSYDDSPLGVSQKHVQLWSLADLAWPPWSRSFDASVIAAVFTPSGTRLAIATSPAGWAHILRLDAAPSHPSEVPFELGGSPGNDVQWHLAVSPDGRWLAATGRSWQTSRRGSLQLWRLTEPEGIESLAQVDGQYDATFSPDSRWLFTRGPNTSSLFRLPSFGAGSAPVVLRDGGLPRFDTRYPRLVLRGETAVHVWSLDVESLERRARAAVGRNFTWDEWNREFPDRNYEKTFPELPVDRSVVEALLATAERASVNLDPMAAWAALLDAMRWAVDLGDPDVAERVCRSGATHGQTRSVLALCDLAVSLDPEGGSAHDARGIARAELGDRAGAIADLRAYLVWARQHAIDAQTIQQRSRWVDEFASGDTPRDLPGGVRAAEAPPASATRSP